MVFFNWATMQMAAKIVYYGPGLCGKTTNLSYIYTKTAPGSRGEMVSLETETDRTLFFDLLPIEVGKVGGFRTRLQLYTVPGQVFYNTTRKLVLKGVDGLVFVADSQRPMADANAESFKNLEENLREMGLTLDSLPLAIQFNKRDLKNIQSVEEMQAALNPDGRWECFEAVAVEGQGVFETLKAITKLTLKSLRKRMATQETGVPVPVGPQPVGRTIQAAPRVAVAPPVSFDPAALRSAAAEGLAVVPEAKPKTAHRKASRDASGGEVEDSAAAPTTGAVVAGEAEIASPEVLQPADAGVHVLAADEAATTAPSVETLEEPLPAAEEAAADEAVPVADEVPTPAGKTWPVEVAAGEAAAEAAPVSPEESEEAAVEFATTSDIAQVVAPAEMRHVKVGSSLDILAELESLRKSSTLRPEARHATTASAPSFDLDSLLQSSVNSRQEVKRKIDEKVGSALGRASRCLVSIQLVDAHGKAIRDVNPVEVELKRGERIRQLSLTLVVNLQGD